MHVTMSTIFRDWSYYVCMHFPLKYSLPSIISILSPTGTILLLSSSSESHRYFFGIICSLLCLGQTLSRSKSSVSYVPCKTRKLFPLSRMQCVAAFLPFKLGRGKKMSNPKLDEYCMHAATILLGHLTGLNKSSACMKN